ncbi:hypothetical protein ACFC0M_29805 [Streptomyces sp. NPDC056149]|uniref:hypothetical protein n=1 Tax=unclassified Streptomyces TaxID=2593676 RepID=UPI0023818AD5|nr:hypothetical protein [Streptomyces sp. WZ-12]
MRRIPPLLTTALAAASFAAAGCTAAPDSPSTPGPGGSSRRTVAPGRPSPVLMPWPFRVNAAEGPRSSASRWEHVAIG